MLPGSFGPASRAISVSLLGALALIALPHCANGDGGRAPSDLGDGEESKLESPATSKPAAPSEPDVASPTSLSPPSDAGTIVVTDAAPSAAGCTQSSECPAVPCTCKVGSIKVEGRLCTAGACVNAPQDVCPTACGLLGGWKGP